MLQKVVDYKLVVNGNPEVLVGEVNKEMQAGWVPSGPVVVFNNTLVQAMVKFQEV